MMMRAILLVLAIAATPGSAEVLRIAAYNTGLSRDGPGVLLHAFGKEPDDEIVAVLAAIRTVRPQVILLSSFDHDLQGRALSAFVDLLAAGPDGLRYPYSFTAPINGGVPSGFDLDGDGLLMGRADAFSWGGFPGDGGMAILSSLPIDADIARTFQHSRWIDLPGAMLPTTADGAPFPNAEAQKVLRLSSRTHWDVPVILPDGGRLNLLAANPTPPLFDGAEKFNAKRNHDEIAFWAAYIDGAVFTDDQGRSAAGPEERFVVLGDLNADPSDGAGLRAGIDALLLHERLQDPAPASEGAQEAANTQRGANMNHAGPPALDTADWGDHGRGPGNLRVDYVLPSRDLTVADAGVFWPTKKPLAGIIAAGPPHRLVWVDIETP